MKSNYKKYEMAIALVVAFFFVVSAIYLHGFLNRCSACGVLNVKEAHRQMCKHGHVYYNCQPEDISEHKNCYLGIYMAPPSSDR